MTKTIYVLTLFFLALSGFSFAQKRPEAGIHNSRIHNDTSVLWTAKVDTTRFSYYREQFKAAQKKPVAKILHSSLQTDTIIRWTSTEDTTKFIYYVQQFRWNKWINCDSVQSLNLKDSVSYFIKVSKFIHTGKNQFRIKANNINTPHLIISQVNFMAQETDICRYIGKCGLENIQFETATCYELYNSDGKRLKSGYGASIYIKDLPKGAYYLNYDNKMEEFIKK
jgi:hypothetical protein